MRKLYIHVLFALLVFFSAATQVAAQLQPEALQQIQSLLNEKASRTPLQRKIDSRLLQAVRESAGQSMAAGVTLERANVNTEQNGLLKVDISAVVSDKLVRKIETAGGTIIFASPQYKTIRAEITMSLVETIAAFPEVRFIEPAIQSTTVGSGYPKNTVNNSGKIPLMLRNNIKDQQAFIPHRPSTAERSRRVTEALEKYFQQQGNHKLFKTFTGTVNAQGDRTHRADDARNTYGYAGQGIRIGVLSDSYNALGVAAADVANGNLPGPGNPIGNTTPVTVLVDNASGGDEGRAMLQIVHDLAPKAQLFFATANLSEASFANNIVALRSAPYNCDIIIDDVFYYDEPAFQDGIVAQAVNTVTASGGMYFSSAGNAGSVVKGTAGVWEGDFNDAGSLAFTGSTKTGTIHNFGTVTVPVNGDIITAVGQGVYNLHWADPAGASANDYDLFLVSAAGVVKGSSTNIQSGSQRPYEQIAVPTLASGDRLVVFKAASAQIRAFSLNTNRGRLTVATTGQTHGHSSAADAFSVAATPAATAFGSAGSPTGPFPAAFSSANQLEIFTSDGPRRIFFNADGTPITAGNFLFATNGGNVRAKPDVTAADGVATTLPAGGLNPFYGTSAAAPHAGAIAALLKSANPALTSAQIRTILTTTALDVEAAGYDNISGFGILQAFQAMQAVNPTPMSTVNIGTVTPSEGAFGNGNGSIDPGEIGNIVVQLTNPSLAASTGITATLTSTTPGVSIIRGTSSFGDLAPSGNGSNTGTPFIIGFSNTIACGTVVNLTLNVTFSGGASPVGFQFTVLVGTPAGSTISSALGSTPATAPAYTFTTGTQTGRLNRNTPVSSCGIQKATPILAATTGARAFDSYTFTNTNLNTICVTVTMNSTNGINLYTAAYNDSGFVPATPNVHFLGDQGTSAALQTFAVNVASGKQYTIVVSEITGATAVGTAYTLSTSYSICAAGPACNPVTITTASIASGATGIAYSQSFAASGGSGTGYFTYALTGNLPAGITFSGNTLTGTPTQAGNFTITLTATDPAGCPAGTMTYTLQIAGNPPASVTATSGTPQTTYPTVAFAQLLQATVKDAANNPLPGVKVIFTAPASGASGTFAGGTSADTVITNSSGIAIAHTFTSNATAGNYTVIAAVNGVTPATFSLANFCPSSFVVTNNADNGPGTLRDILSNACPGITVTFDPGISQIFLTSGELLVSKAVTINGPGADKLFISGNNGYRVFNITSGSGTVNISGLTIRDGKPAATNANGGAGILINSGTLNVSSCVITNNNASLSLNSEGGGVDNEGGIVTIDRCSIINNTALLDGGGVASWSNTMRITNSTISGNTSSGPSGQGGGVYSYVPLTLTNCTIFGNTAQAGGNIYRGLSTVTFRNTIIGGGALVGTGGTGPDIFGTGFTSADFNLIENPAAGTITGVTTHNITGVKANLLPLGYYSSIFPTLLPRSNSPVINTGDSLLVSGLDQRNLARIIGRRADIGAVEANYQSVASLGTPQTAPTNTAFPLPLQAKIVESGMPVAGDSIFFSAPATGASGVFPGSLLTATAVSNVEGLATSPAFTANSLGGRYTVTGNIGVEFPVISYDLTNATTATLPVVFGAMTAQAANCQVQIQWRTYSEQNARDFTVQYSRDGLTYANLATVPARGTSSVIQTYNYTHKSPANGTLYYRIRQTDANGVYTVGDVITVSNSCNSTAFVAYPNPVKDKLIVQVGGNAKQLLTIYDVLGRTMTKMTINGGRYEIDVKGWAIGLYTLTVTQDGIPKYTVKVVRD